MIMEPSIARIIEGVVRLQEEKERVYGVDWKRFGLVSSFFNTYRKLIRLRTIWNSGWKPTPDDTRFDTIIDLFNYLMLSMTLHAELFPDEFKTHILAHSDRTPQDFPSDERGVKVFAREIMLAEAPSGEAPPLSETIPAAIELGESAIEAWLEELASVAARIEDTDARARAGITHDASDRLMAMRKMLDLCLLAALRHAQDFPEEWAPFARRYVESS